MTALLQRFERNGVGRDFAVGDIHGHFTQLQEALDAIGFDPAKDRLFSVGDLVDRGEESDKVIGWLDKPWFHPVRGNHDDYVCRYDTCDIGNWLINGGIWFRGLMDYQQKEFQIRFRELPIAIEIDASIGIVHAECPYGSWGELVKALEEPESNKQLKLVMNSCMWSRRRAEFLDTSWISGIRAVVVGHTPAIEPITLGNVHYIDTRGWRPADGGYFTILDLNTLQPASRVVPENTGTA